MAAANRRYGKEEFARRGDEAYETRVRPHQVVSGDGGTSMTTISLEEAQALLPSLVASLKPGDEIIITRQDQPVARLVPAPPQVRKPRRAGTMVGKLKIVQEDDEHLEDFREYMA